MTPTIIEQVREALAGFVYETTHLSPLEDDGSHKCKISAKCLAAGREALALLDQLPPPMTEAERERLVEEMTKTFFGEIAKRYPEVVVWTDADDEVKKEQMECMSAALAVIERRKGK